MKRNTRAEAAVILNKVLFYGRSISSLSEQIQAHDDHALLQAICYGVLRHFWQLRFIVWKLSKKRDIDDEVLCILLVGLFQLIYLDVSDYAAINESVTACEQLKKTHFKGFVNAILRNTQREKDFLVEKSTHNLEALYNHPRWFINQLKTDWPHDWRNVLKANNALPPMWLRVNNNIISTEAYAKKLEVEFSLNENCSTAIKLVKPCAVDLLPDFSEGEASVQGISTQMAATFLQLEPGLKVLDACAAPGGKTSHCLELQPDLDLLAIDLDEKRLARVDENLERLHLKAAVKQADILEVDSWWDKKPFDRILLDAPCSATGVINRHPDIKHLRKDFDIAQFAETQLKMLKALWPCLKSGGLLLYATCSVLHEENDQVIASFLTAHPDAKEQPLSHPKTRTCPHGIQFLPNGDFDGLYYCLLRKT